jgi:hypothetical protein
MPKKKPSCELCCDVIEKDQDWLQCKGECGSIVHRYCAGVTKRQFDELSKGSLPFVCQWCSLKSASSTIQKLQSEVEALKTELATTKSTLTKLQNDYLQIPSQTQSYASVAAPAATRYKKQQQRRPTRSQQGSVTKSLISSVSVEATASFREASAANRAANSNSSAVTTTRSSLTDR